jgi:hypothetical protein
MRKAPPDADMRDVEASNRTTCSACGLVNFATSETCRRCGASVLPESPEVAASSAPTDAERSFGRWLLWVLGATVTIVTIAYLSLLVSSDGLTSDERRTVLDAMVVLEQAGFSREALALRHLASYRRTDNWWNQHVGHQTAYAATNFPFGVVTLYPAFFKYSTDDAERATILLHESYHLFGAREETALQRVWIEKERLGWTSPRYSHTRVWKNTREWTLTAVPNLFSCGEDGESDCLE